MTATRRLDALRSCPAGRYEDGLVVVDGGRGARDHGRAVARRADRGTAQPPAG